MAHEMSPAISTVSSSRTRARHAAAMRCGWSFQRSPKMSIGLGCREDRCRSEIVQSIALSYQNQLKMQNAKRLLQANFCILHFAFCIVSLGKVLLFFTVWGKGGRGGAAPHIPPAQHCKV